MNFISRGSSVNSLCCPLRRSALDWTKRPHARTKTVWVTLLLYYNIQSKALVLLCSMRLFSPPNLVGLQVSLLFWINSQMMNHSSVNSGERNECGLWSNITSACSPFSLCSTMFCAIHVLQKQFYNPKWL